MRNRVLAGVGAGLLAGTLLLGVGVAAFEAGRRDDGVTRTITDDDGAVVRVVEVDGVGRRGPGFGLVLVPLGLLAVGALAYGAGRRTGAGWGPRYGPGPGAWGPGPGGWGPRPGCGPHHDPNVDPTAAATTAPAASTATATAAPPTVPTTPDAPGAGDPAS
jgi:hypothetical protein